MYLLISLHTQTTRSHTGVASFNSSSETSHLLQIKQGRLSFWFWSLSKFSPAKLTKAEIYTIKNNYEEYFQAVRVHISLQLYILLFQPGDKSIGHNLTSGVRAIELGIYNQLKAKIIPFEFLTGVNSERGTMIQPIFWEKGNTSKMNDSIFTPLGCFGLTNCFSTSS